MLPLNLPWRLIGAAASLALVLGGVWYFGNSRYNAGYQAHVSEIAKQAQDADAKYRKARRARGEPLYRDLLTYRVADPEKLIVRVPVEVPHGTTTCPADRLGPEFVRQFNAISDGQIPAGAVPGAPGGDSGL